MSFAERTDSYTAAIRASDHHVQQSPQASSPSRASSLAATSHRDPHISVDVHSGSDSSRAEEGNREQDAAAASTPDQVFVNVLPSPRENARREGEGATQDTAIDVNAAQEMLPQDWVDFNGATFGRKVIQVSVPVCQCRAQEALESREHQK